MTEKQLDLFYEDLARVCAKHNIGSIVGMWFHRTTDYFGSIHGVDSKATGMECAVVAGISQEFQVWLARHGGNLNNSYNRIFEIKPANNAKG